MSSSSIIFPDSICSTISSRRSRAPSKWSWGSGFFAVAGIAERNLSIGRVDKKRDFCPARCFNTHPPQRFGSLMTQNGQEEMVQILLVFHDGITRLLSPAEISPAAATLLI